MIAHARSALCLLAMTLTATGLSPGQDLRPDEVIAVERAALDLWGRGDPLGFLQTYSPEITYFDPSGDKRVDGLDAMKALLAPIAGKVSVGRYDMVDPKVQRHGDIVVLTYNLVQSCQARR